MRTHTLLFAFFLGRALPCPAQYIVELKDTITIRGIGRLADTLIVTFDELAPIGIVYRGDATRPVNAFFAKPVGQALAEVIRPDPAGANNREIVLRVNRLHIDEFGAAAQCGLHLEFLEQREGNHIRLFEYGTTLTSRTGISLKDDHAENINRALRQSFTAFEEAQRSGQLTATPVNKGVLTSPPSIGPCWKLLSCDPNA